MAAVAAACSGRRSPQTFNQGRRAPAGGSAFAAAMHPVANGLPFLGFGSEAHRAGDKGVGEGWQVLSIRGFPCASIQAGS